MKLNKNKKGKDLSLDTLIGPNTVFEGSIQSDRSVCVEGSIRGRIEAKGEVVIGRVIGNINARSRLEITPTGRVTGDIEATTITVAEGGMVDGSFKMMEATETAYPQLESGLSAKESDQASIQSPSDPIESLPQA